MRFKIILLLLAFILNNLVYAQEATPDLGAMAEQFQSCITNNSQQAKTPELLIFVSFSMPAQSLKLWAQQADKVNSPLLLRGFIDNSIQATTQQTVRLFSASQQGGFHVDPEKFGQYKINHVPAVVLVHGETYDVVYGDTSLEAALERMSHYGAASLKPVAQEYLTKIRGSHG